MNATQREQLRLSCLRHLDAQADAAPGRGLSEAVLRQMLRAEGAAVETADVAAALVYLRDKGFARTPPKAVSPENALWEITAEGRDHYAFLTK